MQFTTISASLLALAASLVAAAPTASLEARGGSKGLGQTCQDSNECQSNLRCLNNGRNEYKCAQAVQFGQYCTVDSVCADGFRCENQKCIDRVNNTRGLGALCISNNQCKTDLRCLYDNIGDKYTCRGPVQIGGFCTVDPVCVNGAVCKNKQCAKRQ